jgi:2-polyprenyl-3-methyl-5-hydroxy-6-metoxy-1,4-benzoquinol methylase
VGTHTTRDEAIALMDGDLQDTSGSQYTRRLQGREAAWWKRALDVQRPYRWNLERQQLGRTLDVGCGLGRNLATLPAGSVGIDHNVTSVQEARRRGRQAYLPEEFAASPHARPGEFDGMLVSHVIEHLDAPAGAALVARYLPYLRAGGRVFFVCPQERGYRSDPTHVRFVDGEDLVRLSEQLGLSPGAPYSFPFPRSLGGLFTYNEFCLLALKPDET